LQYLTHRGNELAKMENPCIATRSSQVLNDHVDADDDCENFWIEQAPAGALPSPLLSGLQDMEESLRCLICRDLFHIPVMVEPCHHYFCSQCIRNCWIAMEKKRFTAVKSQSKIHCPTCRVQVDGKMDYAKCLKSNRRLEEAVTNYKRIRPFLKQNVDALQSQHGEAAALAQTTISTVAAAQSRPCSTSLPSSLSHHRYNNNNNNNNSTSCQSTRKTLERKRRLLYNNYNRKQMQQLCRQEGLSTDGSEDVLKERHRAYCSKINSECDAALPRSPAEILQEFNREEAAQRRAARGPHKPLQTLYETRRQAGEAAAATATKITTGNAQLDAKISNNFADMIAKLKKQKQQKVAEAAKRMKTDRDCDDSTAATLTKPAESTTALDECAPSETLVAEHEESKSALHQSTALSTGSLQPTSKELASTQNSNVALSTDTKDQSTKDHSNKEAHVLTPHESEGARNENAIAIKNSAFSTEKFGAPTSAFSPVGPAVSDDPSEIRPTLQQQQEQEKSVSCSPRSSQESASSVSGSSQKKRRNSASPIDLTIEDQPQRSTERSISKTSTKRGRPRKLQSTIQVVPRDTTATTVKRDAVTSESKRRKTRSGGSLIGPWNCSACTFRNTKNTWSSATCEICGTSRRTPVPT